MVNIFWNPLNSNQYNNWTRKRILNNQTVPGDLGGELRNGSAGGKSNKICQICATQDEEA